MWEEDPKWQEANYRFLLFLAAALTVGVAAWSAVEREWAMLGYWMLGLATLLSALCIYAAIVWIVGHSIVWTARACKKLFRRNHDV